MEPMHQSGLTTGITSLHGRPKFTEGQLRVFTGLIMVDNTAKECTLGPKQGWVPADAMDVV